MSQAPANPIVGQSWYDVSVKPTGQMKVWDGEKWNDKVEWDLANGPGSKLVLKEE